MGQSVVGTSEQIMLLCKFEHLKGAYERFDKYFQVYELRNKNALEVADEAARLNILEEACNVIIEADEDLSSQINDIKELYSHLPEYEGVVAETLADMSIRLEKDLTRYNELMDQEFNNRVDEGRSLGELTKAFFKSFW